MSSGLATRVTLTEVSQRLGESVTWGDLYLGIHISDWHAGSHQEDAHRPPDNLIETLPAFENSFFLKQLYVP
jgi:hypothetical protein